jgi:outer membrane protein
MTQGHSMNHGLISLAMVGLLWACGSAALAQSAGSVLVKIGANTITPRVKSGDLSAPAIPGTTIDVKSASSVILTATYMLTDMWSLEFYAGLPYKHEVVGDGTIKGVGKLGTVKQVSPTLFAQYRFLEASAALRPYLGLGLTYAYFYGEQGSGTLTALTNAGGSPTRLSASAAFGLSPQLGVTYKFDDRWFIDASVVKTYLKNTTTLSTGQTIDTKLDPLSTGVSIGYRF